ncbi:hypothetical protein TRFO_04454 [Tritrichomonas foetus]|uniref:Uncharacterized protein n=1 Tax=Tritrichomonas foetus TaxID=1144522 RepID=A0A1J4KEN0_9EUKA|nr:hypothetical protein TRFO_04454 [Tritrichomonas foetus]|eukprot:OHT09903.1 hypothetical protein TRFO_04454 [Tritrichomonas foetus]
MTTYLEPLAELPKASLINIGPHEPYMDDLDLSPRQINFRDLHRCPDYEDYMTLIDQKNRLVTEINEVRRENEKMKKELIEKEKDLILQEEAMIDSADKIETEKENAYQLRRVMNAQKQLDELNVLSNELNSQYNFLHTYFSFHKEEELRSHTGLQSNQAANEMSELTEMESVLTKIYTRLDGPVAKQKQIWQERNQIINDLSKHLRKLKKLEQQLESEALYNAMADQQVLPEELKSVRDDLKKKLEILRHRKYNRTLEIRKMKQREAQSRVAADELLELDEKKKKEVRERERFRDRMQKKHRAEDEEKKRLQSAVAVKIGPDDEDNEEKWRMMITYVKEAHD